MVRLVRRLARGRTYFRQSRLLFIGPTILCAITLFWLLSSTGGLPLTKANVTPASAGDAHITLPTKSAGCGKPASVAPGTSVNQAILSGGITRSYVLHTPRSYLDTTAHALVLNFHGHGSTASHQQYLTGFSTLADADNFIVVYPQGAVGPDETSPVPYFIPCEGKVQQCTYLSRYVARVSSSSEKAYPSEIVMRLEVKITEL